MNSVSVTLPREAIVVEVSVTGLSYSASVFVASSIVLVVVVVVIVGTVAVKLMVVRVMLLFVLTFVVEVPLVVAGAGSLCVTVVSADDELLLFVTTHGDVATENNWHVSSCSTTSKDSG